MGQYAKDLTIGKTTEEIIAEQNAALQMWYKATPSDRMEVEQAIAEYTRNGKQPSDKVITILGRMAWYCTVKDINPQTKGEQRENGDNNE